MPGYKAVIVLLAAGAAAGCLGGCFEMGTRQLRTDQVEYGRALADAKKREILGAIVGLRYADPPAFLSANQIIAAYALDATAGTTFNSRPDPGGSLAQATGMVTYSNHPTFTFTPPSGEAYAATYIRPLPPALVLPLANSQIPVDLLLRITAQSIGALQNGTMLGGPSGNGSPEFFELLRILRQLQLAGELAIQYQLINQVGRVFLSLGPLAGPNDPEAGDLARVRQLLRLSPETNQYEIVYGQNSAGGDKIALATRSILGILGDLSAEIEVPAEDISSGRTKPTVQLVGGEARPTIVVHVGKTAPGNAYVSTNYGPSVYWIDPSDFDSKYAFTIVQNLMALAEVTDTSKAPVLTIPAN